MNVTLGFIFVASLRKEWPMTFIAVQCPHCQSDQIVKRGKTARGTQRYLCQNTLCPKGSFLLDYWVVFQKWRWPCLHCPSKGIAVDKQAKDVVMHLGRFRKADGLAGQAFNTRPYGQMLALDFLRVAFARWGRGDACRHPSWVATRRGLHKPVS